MTREAVSYLVLLAIIIGSLFNIRCIAEKTELLRDTANEAYSLLIHGDSEGALRLSEEVCETWDSLDSYTHIFIRHDEIGATSDALFEFLSDISEENAKAAYGSLRKLCDHLDSLSRAERPSLGSIF